MQGGADVVSQLATNAAEDEPLSSGLGSAAASFVDRGMTRLGSAVRSAAEYRGQVGRFFAPDLAPASASLRNRLLGQVLFTNIAVALPEGLLENQISF